MSLKALYDGVIVKEEDSSSTAGSIAIVTEEDGHGHGTVLSVGPTAEGVVVGDHVLYSKGKSRLLGTKYPNIIVIRSVDISAVESL